MSIIRTVGAIACAVIAAVVSIGLYPGKSNAQTLTRYAPLSHTGFQIASGPDGNLWLTGSVPLQILKITPDGVITAYPVGLPADGEGEDIVAGPDGNMWFTVSGDPLLCRITLDGAITEFPIGLIPGAIAGGPDGDLWFTESGGNRIGKMTPGGAVTLYSAGISAGASPISIAAGPDGNLWFPESMLGKIAKITTAGVVTEYSAGITPGAVLEQITLGPDHNLWFTEEGTGGIGKITPAGVITEYRVKPTNDTNFLFITAGPDGNIWFTDFVAGDAYSMTTDGVVTEYSADQSGGSEEFSMILGLTGGPDGTIWFTQHSSVVTDVNGIVKLTLPKPSVLVASVLPGARTVKVGTPATVFATMINAGASPLNNCQIGLPADAPAGLQISYQTTDPATNALTGQPNQPVTIAGNDGLQTFLLSFQATAPLIASAQALKFSCDGAVVSETQWLNTVDLAFTDPTQAAQGDFIAIAAAATPGVVSFPTNGVGAFSVAMINNADATYNNHEVSAGVDTGLAVLPITATLCQTNPATGVCLAAPSAFVEAQAPSGSILTFSVFVTASGDVPFDPAINRIFVRFNDPIFSPGIPDAELHGSASVAVRTN